VLLPPPHKTLFDSGNSIRTTCGNPPWKCPFAIMVPSVVHIRNLRRLGKVPKTLCPQDTTVKRPFDQAERRILKSRNPVRRKR